ncbi:MAG: TraB/GumN family protein [Microscillaceae bacterium]|nr:TraB/GumN family protein [Microscillaceae bacterium]
MKKSLLFCCIVLGWGVNTQAQSLENSVFWEITSPHHAQPSYLFGTHHLHSYQFIEKNPSLLQALDVSQRIVGEMVIDSTHMAAVYLKLAMAMMMPPSQSLDKLLSPEQYQATDQCLRQNIGMGIALFNNVKPIFLYQLIMVAKYMKTQNQEAPPPSLENPLGNSMDGFFQQYGKNKGREVLGLETVDDQLKALYDGYSLTRQVEMLMLMVNDQAGGSSEELVSMTEMYRQQDLNALQSLLERNTQPDEMQSLLIDRNQQWMPKLDEWLRQPTSLFIAVGAGHLPGSYGLIAQLRQKGYVLKPLAIEIQ